MDGLFAGEELSCEGYHRPWVEEGCGFFGRRVSGIDRVTGAFWRSIIPSLGVCCAFLGRCLREGRGCGFFSSVSGDGFVYLVVNFRGA